MDTIRFSIGTTLDGFEVVDRDGRPVSPTFDNETVQRVCADLNAAYAKGKRALARALGALETA